MLKKSRSYYLIILLPIAVLLALLLVLSIWLFNNAGFLKRETSEKYSTFITAQFPDIKENRSEDLFVLPKEYKSIKRISLKHDEEIQVIYLNDGLARKNFFLINNELCYMYYIRGEYYTTTTYPDIYNAKTSEKIATLLEKPQGYFIFDDYLYYVYGKEKITTYFDINSFVYGNPFLTSNFKDTHFARLNLNTKVNEEIERKYYEEKRNFVDFTDFSTTTVSVNKVEIYVWKDNDITGINYPDGKIATYYSLFYYSGIKKDKFAVYGPRSRVNSIFELNEKLLKFNDLNAIDLYQVNTTDFTKDEMAAIADKILPSKKNISKIIGLYEIKAP